MNGREEAAYQKALSATQERGVVSVPFLMRHCCLGYQAAKRIISRMRDDGVIGAANATGISALKQPTKEE